MTLLHSVLLTMTDILCAVDNDSAILCAVDNDSAIFYAVDNDSATLCF